MPIGLSSSFSSSSGHYDPIITWERTFTDNGVFNVPNDVYELSVVCVGGGGGGAGTVNGGGGGYGGDLRWIRKIDVTPGEDLRVVVGSGGTGGVNLGIAGAETQLSKLSTLSTVTSATSASGNTVYTSSGHSFQVGDVVTVTGITPDSYNGSSLTVTARNSTTFTVVKTSSGTYSSGGTAVKVLLTAAGGSFGSNVDNDAASKPAPRAQNGTSTTISLPNVGGGTGGQGGWEEKGVQGGGGGGAGGYTGNGGGGGDGDEAVIHQAQTGIALPGINTTSAQPAPGLVVLGALVAVEVQEVREDLLVVVEVLACLALTLHILF